MCQEDIEIGRLTRIKYSQVTCTVAGVKIVGANTSRIRLILSCPATNAVTIADSQATAVAGGLILRNGVNVLAMTVEDFGQAVMSEVWGATSVGTDVIGVLEVIQEYPP